MGWLCLPNGSTVKDGRWHKVGRKPDIIIERRYSNDPADWVIAAEGVAKILITLATPASRPRDRVANRCLSQNY